MYPRIEPKTTRVVLGKHAKRISNLLNQERTTSYALKRAALALEAYTTYHAGLYIPERPHVSAPFSTGPEERPHPTGWDTQHIGYLAKDLVEILDSQEPDKGNHDNVAEAWKEIARFMTALAIHTPGGKERQYPTVKECSGLQDNTHSNPIQ